MEENPRIEEIQQAIQKRYSEVALSAEGKFKYSTGREGALKLGYAPDKISRIPDS